MCICVCVISPGEGGTLPGLSPVLFRTFMDRISRCSQGAEGVLVW